MQAVFRADVRQPVKRVFTTHSVHLSVILRVTLLDAGTTALHILTVINALKESSIE